jgi:hypothetical protein
MNPSWLPGIVGSALTVVNLIWTGLNLQMRADVKAALSEQTSELKAWMAEFYVSKEIYHLRRKPEGEGSE